MPDTAEPFCHNCRHGRVARGADNKPNFQARVCKRFPPTVMLLPGASGPQMNTVWPIVGNHDTCGEWAAGAVAAELPLPGEEMVSEDTKTN